MAMRPRVAASAPPMSGRAGLVEGSATVRSARLSLTRPGSTSNANAATGMLIRKIQRQLPGPISTMTPEITDPRVPPRPARPPQMPSALVRSRGSWKSSATRPRAAGAANASPMPWMKRLVTSIAGFWARPQVTEATPKMAIPMRNNRLRPTRSERRPPSSSRPPAIRT